MLGILLLVGTGLTAWTRSVVSDQEKRLLQERGSAAGLVLTSSIGNVDALMGQIGIAARVSAAAPESFQDAAAQQMANSPLLRALAVVRETGAGLVVQISAGTALTPGQALEGARADTASEATRTSKVVATKVFRDGADLVLGFAMGPPTAPPGTVLYREVRIVPGAPTRSTQAAPFAELNGVLYASAEPDPAQLVLSTVERPRRGQRTYRQVLPVGDSQWLLVVAAKHQLVGTLMAGLPWLVGFGALAGSLLAVAVLDGLLRRQDYAVALVGRRTAQLRDSLASLEVARAEADAARDQALEASELKSQFLANMSHEIRTPLNGVIGMTGLLLDTPLVGEQVEFAETARRSGEALLDLINDILDFSKIEAGRLELETAPFDLAGLLEDVAELFAVEAQQKGLEITTWIAPNVPAVMSGDQGRVRQVLTNLVSNAVKFTEHGEVAISLAVDRAADPAVVRCAVRDSGIGISSDQRQRVFESFAQADASTTRRYGGTGLGLAISQRLAEMIGGSLTFESEFGGGTTFWFTLPLDPLCADRQPGANSTALAGLRVLVVDDNPTNRRVLQRQLRAWSVEPTAVADGVSALNALRLGTASGSAFDVVLLDQDMPDMDGFDVVDEVAADASLDQVRLVMLTSVQWPRGTHVRLCGSVSKPLRRAQLFNTLATAIGSPARLAVQGAAPAVLDRAKRPSRGRRALVVEDHPVNQRVVCAMLTRLGFRVDLANDGAEAIAAATRLPYDVVLMDCQMPRMSGYDAAREIRRSEAGGRRVPIVALTAAAMKGVEERCLAAGMDAYLAKPIRPQDLSRMLGSVLGSATSSEAAPASPSPSASLGRNGSGGDIDHDTLEVVRSLGILDSMSADFRRTAPADIEVLKASLAAADQKRTAEVAHRLKGASLMLGASRISGVVAEIESQVQSGRCDHALALVPVLERSYDDFLGALG